MISSRVRHATVGGHGRRAAVACEAYQYVYTVGRDEALYSGEPANLGLQQVAGMAESDERVRSRAAARRHGTLRLHLRLHLHGAGEKAMVVVRRLRHPAKPLALEREPSTVHCPLSAVRSSSAVA